MPELSQPQAGLVASLPLGGPPPLLSLSVSVCVLQQSHQSVIHAVSETHVRGQLKPLITSEPVRIVHWRDPAHSHLPEGQESSFRLCAGVYTPCICICAVTRARLGLRYVTGSRKPP